MHGVECCRLHPYCTANAAFCQGGVFLFPAGGEGATSSRKEEKRLKAFFRINVPARDGRLRGLVGVLLGISTTKGVPPWILLRMWDSAFGPRTDSVFHAADRLEVTELGAELSKSHVQYKQR